MGRRNLVESTLKQVRDVQVPTWWTLGQVLFGAVFAVVFAFFLLGGNADPVPGADPPPGRSGGPAPTATQDPDDPQDTPTGRGPATVSVPSADGSSVVKVDAAAYRLALEVAAAYHDPQVAAGIPVADGGTFESPVPASKRAKVEDVLFSDEDGGTLAFLALVDADGDAGPKPSDYRPMTLVNEDDTWKVATY